MQRRLVMLGLICGLPLVAALPHLWTTSAQPAFIAAFYAPSRSPFILLAQTDGRLAVQGQWPGVMVAYANRPEADFARDLRHAGAWLTIPLRNIRVCMPAQAS